MPLLSGDWERARHTDHAARDMSPRPRERSRGFLSNLRILGIAEPILGTAGTRGEARLRASRVEPIRGPLRLSR
jgi:hypothetical protein